MGGDPLIVQGVIPFLTPGGAQITDANIAVIAIDLADAFINSGEILRGGVVQSTELVYPEAPDYVAKLTWMAGPDFPDSLPSFEPLMDRAELAAMFQAALTRARTVGDFVTWGLHEGSAVGSNVMAFTAGYFRWRRSN
jgi:hypothetical protein